MATEFRLSEVWIYPIKSLKGISMRSAEVLAKGLKHDRRFMLIDAHGVALTQRTYPRMALFEPSIDGTNCTVTYKGEKIEWPLHPAGGEAYTAVIWNDKVKVLEVSHNISTWFSHHLETSCKLVFFPEDGDRPVDPDYQINLDQVSLADAFPLLIIGQESLNDLNRKLASPVPMNRFRPNLVFTGGDAYGEDTWSDIVVGNNKFRAVKPCARCVLTTVDQNTALTGPEPLRTLATYRRIKNKVMFGQNLLILEGTSVNVGDKINVETYR